MLQASVNQTSVMAIPLTGCAASPDKSEFKYTNLDEFGIFCEMTEISKACQNALNFRYLLLNVERLNLGNFTAGLPAGGDGRQADQADVDTAGDGTDWDERPGGTDIVIEVTDGVSCRLSRSPLVVIEVGLTIPASVAVIVSRRIVFKMTALCSCVCNDVTASRLYP